MSYLFIKQIHIILVVLSISFFSLRFVWSIKRVDMLQATWVKIAPHIIDTLLLSVGVYLMITSHTWPTQQPWLATKLVALIVYILLGTIAIKRGKTIKSKAIAGCLAIIVFAYMVSVAVTRNPLLISYSNLPIFQQSAHTAQTQQNQHLLNRSGMWFTLLKLNNDSFVDKDG